MSAATWPRDPPLPRATDVGGLVCWAARRLARAGLHFGHGTDNAFDEAGALVFHALGIAHADAPRAYAWRIDARGRAQLRALVARRIRERVPSAYLTGRTWFAGHEIEVTPAVLVPRSPIAELCASGFAPWIDARRVRCVLDIGTGSGCIAIACAYAFPAARIDAVDVSHAALEVAARNIRAHGLEQRVRPRLSNVYAGVGARRYDIIVSNPPYVPAREVPGLPAEYGREPQVGLAAGRRGLDVVERILAGAEAHLERGGILVVEVGDTEGAVRRRWPEVPFTWLEFEHGGGGVFLLTAAAVRNHREALAS
jgi:ribosomal protein L3 glutamine methyltransferase